MQKGAETAYLSLGSNLGDRAQNLRDATGRLVAAGRVTSVSCFYETEPVELTEQPWFLNCAVALETLLTPPELMKTLLAIEQAMGRRRTKEKGPRTIDIDILLYGNEIVDSPELQIPHPAMNEAAVRAGAAGGDRAGSAASGAEKKCA